MDLYQPSLWDNVALENGYTLLSDLNLKEAITQFNEAFQSPIGDQESIQAAIATCGYWQKRIPFPPELPVARNRSDHGSQYISGFLEDYLAYPFDSRMTGFKKNLLGYLTDIFQQSTALDPKTFETIFDLLLDLEMFQKSENLASHYVNQRPEKHFLLYFLAQAQWLNNNKTEACNNYARALLYFPDRTLKNRVMHRQLKMFVNSHGLEMAPVFGRLYEILPYMPIEDEIHPLNKQHRNAIQSYLLLQKLLKSMYTNDHKGNIQYRKQLKEQAPILFDAYLRRLKERE